MPEKILEHVFPATSALPEKFRGGVVAIGNFDGVHLGHRGVLDKALAISKTKNLPAIILTFEPHPRSWFNPAEPVFRLTPHDMKASLLLRLGFDAIVAETFDGNFASTSAEEFVERHLVANLGASEVVTGFNFHFGQKRRGTPDFLKAEGERLGFGVTQVAPVKGEAGKTISSSRIRELLAEGRVSNAAELLGRNWQVEGIVAKGAQLGRTLGFPTANLKLPDETALKHGIYAVRLIRENGSVHDGVASFGRRPTFDNGAPLLETFIFDFSGDLYGEKITVELVEWIRPEEKFEDADALVRQMHKDSEKAGQLLAERV